MWQHNEPSAETFLSLSPPRCCRGDNLITPPLFLNCKFNLSYEFWIGMKNSTAGQWKLYTSPYLGKAPCLEFCQAFSRFSFVKLFLGCLMSIAKRYNESGKMKCLQDWTYFFWNAPPLVEENFSRVWHLPTTLQKSAQYFSFSFCLTFEGMVY